MVIDICVCVVLGYLFNYSVLKAAFLVYSREQLT
jgi:hypothetical protein